MKFISAVTSIGSLQYHSNQDYYQGRTMVSSGHTTTPVASRLPQKRDSRIPGPGIQRQVAQHQNQCNAQLSGRKTRTPSVPTPSTSNCSNSHQSKSSMSDISSRRSSSPASNSSSLSLSKNSGSSSLIPGAPEIVINRRINTTDKQSNYSRPTIRPPRPTSIPSAPNHTTVATNGSIPPGHFSPAKNSQPVINPRSDSCHRSVKSITSPNGWGGNTSNTSMKSKGNELGGMKKVEYSSNGRKVGNNHHQSSSSSHQSNPSPPTSSQPVISSSTSPSSSLPSSSSTPSSASSSPQSVNDRTLTADRVSNKENSSFNSSGSSNESHMKESKSSNLMSSQNMVNSGVPASSLSLFRSGGSSLPSSPAKIVPSGNSSSSMLSRTTSPGHFISHNYHNRTNEDFHLSVYSDSECSSRNKSKVNILYSYSPSARSNFPAISEIAGVIETSTNLSNNNSNLIENNSLLAKCCNKAMSQLESSCNFSPRKDQLSSNVNPNLDRERVILNNSLRSSPIRELEMLPSNGIGKCPSLRNLSNGQPSATNGFILAAMPSNAYIASQQFRRLSKNSDLRGSAASLLSASSNFSSAEDKQAIEIKKLRSELSKANEKVATLSTQLLTSTQMVTAFEQSLASTITRFQQLSVSSENKDREISRLKSTIDSLRKQYDSLLKEGISTSQEHRNVDGTINGEASDRESIKGSGAEGQHKKKLKVRSMSKDRESDGSGPGWLRGSITRAFRKGGRPRTRSGNDSGSDADSCSSRTNLNVLDQGFRSMPGTPIHSPRVNVSNQIDEELTGIEVLELKNKLQEKDRVLTDIRLEALSVAHQMDGLKESNSRMRSEIETLRVENRRLQRMVQRQSITSSVGSLASCADSALTFASEGKENNLDKSPSKKNFNSETDLDPLLNALMKLKDATANN